MATKTSILVFYLRLSKNTQKILRLASWLVLIIVNLAGAILTLMNIFQCRPIDGSWNPNVHATCIPLLTEFICSAPVNIVTDLAILALPIPVITGMRLPPRQKTILVLTFTLAIFVTIVDVVRIFYLQQAISVTPTTGNGPTSPIFGNAEDFSWNASLSLMWSAVEVNVGITCACIPTLKPLVIRILPAMLVDPNRTHRTSQEQESKETRTPSNVTPMQDSSDGSQPQATPGHQPIVAPHEAHIGAANRTSEEVSIRDFLKTTGPTPDTAHRASLRSHADNRMPTSSTFGTGDSKQENSVYFGFVNMKRPKSMLRASVAESWRYCTAVTILFLLWGFSYGLLNTLNNVIAAIGGFSTAQTLGLTSIYFGGGYFFGPLLVGEWLLRHDEHHRYKRRDHGPASDSVGGFKVTFIVGLLIYGTGTIMFWPSAVLNAFGGFMVSNFVVGFGLGVLETAANPFLALCGPDAYSEMRLLLAQGVQGVGSVLSGLLAQKVFFKHLGTKGYTNSLSLLGVQWTYLAITLFCFLLALFFYYMPLPEVTDRELGRVASALPVDPKKRNIGGLSLRTWCIIFAVLAQWTYVAAQETMSIWFGSLLTALLPVTSSTTGSAGGDKVEGMTLSVPDYLLIAHTAFAVSRFAAGYIAYLSVKHPCHGLIPTPRTMLTISAALNVLFAILIVALRPTGNPNLLVIPIVLFFLAEGPLWPLIFALGLRGQGKRTKRAAAWLTMGGSGPAFWPFVIYAVINGGGNIHTAFIVVIVLLFLTLIYPLFLTFVKDAKVMVDPSRGAGGGSGSGGDGGLERRDSQPSEVHMDELLAARRRAMSDAADGGGGMLRRIRSSFASRSGRRASRASISSPTHQATSSGAAGEGDQGAAPWEHQELDTSILADR